MAVEDIFDAVLAYQDDEIGALTQAEIDAGTDVRMILDDGLIAALDLVGEKFSMGTLFVPEMLLAADAVQAGLEVLRPLLVDTGFQPIGTVVLGTVKGDLHDIGKNLVGMMLEGAGFRVIDLASLDDPALVQDHKDQGRQHRQQQRPQDSEKRLPVLGVEVSHRQAPRQSPRSDQVAPHAGKQLPGRPQRRVRAIDDPPLRLRADGDPTRRRGGAHVCQEALFSTLLPGITTAGPRRRANVGVPDRMVQF